MQLTIHTPCQQPWQDMKLGETGRFCEHCQKTVVDFASMSDQQIQQYFASQSQSVCGRFTLNQLNRTLVSAPNLPVRTAKQRWMGLLAAGLLSWSTAQGQSVNENLPERKSIPYSMSPKQNNFPQPKSSVTPDSRLVIEGKVIDQTTQAPLPRILLVKKGAEWGVTTDEMGYFRLFLTNHQDDKVILKISGIGYIEREIECQTTNLKPVTISLAVDTAALNQVYVIGYPTVNKKPNSTQKQRN